MTKQQKIKSDYYSHIEVDFAGCGDVARRIIKKFIGIDKYNTLLYRFKINPTLRVNVGFFKNEIFHFHY